MKKTGCRPFAVFWRAALMLIVLAVCALPKVSPAQAAGNCDGVGVWYAAVADVKQQVDTAEHDPSVSFGVSNPGLYRDAAAQLRELDAPATAADAQNALIDGYRSLASFQEQMDAITAGGQSGTLATFQNYYNAILVLSEARRSLLTGYLGWTVTGVSCGLLDDQLLPSETRGCDGVAGYMDTAAAVTEGFWNSWWQSFHDRRGTQGQQTDTSANPLGPGELLSAYAFQDGLKLATTPAPETAMPLQTQTVGNMLALSELYLVDLIGSWAAYYGLDQATINQITEQFQQQQQLVMQQQEEIGLAWDDLGKQCGVQTPYPRATWDQQ